MLKEWNDPYNSFNSWKGLLYADWYYNIIEWKESKTGFILKAPIIASIDPAQACNLKCSHCNAGRYLDKKIIMSREHILNLVDFLVGWGVNAICFGGGGEPTLNPALAEAITKATDSYLQTSVVTNGTIMDDYTTEVMAQRCRWVGISVDAGSRQTYLMGKKVDLFDKVIKNIEKIMKHSTKCHISYKFLIFNYNQHEIFGACKLAKSLGVRDFHARPADFSHQGMKHKTIKNFYNVDLIKDQIEQCHKLETKDFHIFTPMHKLNEDFTPKKRFNQCYASPISIQFCADGNIYFCSETRQMPFYKLGTHVKPNDILSIWGGKKHYDLVFKNGCKNCSSKCLISPYNEQLERLFINNDDPMFKWFV